MRFIINFLLILTLSYLLPLNAKSHYLSIDANGHLIYSDRPPKQGEYQRRSETQVNPITWKKTPKIQSLKKQKKKPVASDNIKLKQLQCQKLSLQVKELQLKLKHRLSANAFEKIKQRLIAKRYQYQKLC